MAFDKIRWVSGTSVTLKFLKSRLLQGGSRQQLRVRRSYRRYKWGDMEYHVFKAADITGYLSTHKVLCSTFKVYFLLMLLLMCLSRLHP